MQALMTDLGLSGFASAGALPFPVDMEKIE